MNCHEAVYVFMGVVVGVLTTRVYLYLLNRYGGAK
jgi:hypothetical protein